MKGDMATSHACATTFHCPTEVVANAQKSKALCVFCLSHAHPLVTPPEGQAPGGPTHQF